jgi:transcriptional regulator with XRE-family HTH domain
MGICDGKSNFAVTAHYFARASDYLSRMDDKWFKAQQKRVGITADEIAAVLGRDRSVVSKILNGKQRMTLEWAGAFAKALDVPLAIVLEKAGVADTPVVHQLTPGFAGGDAMPFVHGPAASAESARQRAIASVMGEKNGVDVWRVKGRAMALAGLLEGDFILVDTFASERVRPGDVVIAQVYNPRGATTVLRRFEPPVLVAASPDKEDARVHVVDGENVVIRGKVTASWRV